MPKNGANFGLNSLPWSAMVKMNMNDAACGRDRGRLRGVSGKANALFCRLNRDWQGMVMSLILLHLIDGC